MELFVRTTLLTILLGCLAITAAAHAQEEEEPTGQLTIEMDSDYAKVSVDGESWSSVEFERGGKRAIVTGLDLNRDPVVITVTPVYDHLGPVTLEVPRKAFKRKRVKRMYILAAKRKVKFPKAKDVKPAPAPKPEEEKEAPKPEEEEDDL